VSINVDDTSVAVEFYVDVMGLTLRDDRPNLGFDGAWLDLAGQQVHLLELTVPTDVGQHFAIRVADLDAAISNVRSKGVEVGDPTPIGNSRQAFLHDPSGNLIELHQPGS